MHGQLDGEAYGQYRLVLRIGFLGDEGLREIQTHLCIERSEIRVLVDLSGLDFLDKKVR